MIFPSWWDNRTIQELISETEGTTGLDWIGLDWIGFLGAMFNVYRMLDLLTDYLFLFYAANVAAVTARYHITIPLVNLISVKEY